MNALQPWCLTAWRRVLLCGTILLSMHSANPALTITEKVTPTLGTLLSGASGRNFILNTDQTVSGTDAADYMFGAVSGELTVKKTGGSQSANILADNITTSGGVSVNAVPCKWDTQAQTTCDGSGINVTVGGTKALMVGVNIDTSQVHSGGQSASVTYDITITLL
ncbi:MAG: hypothetical protein R3192_13245 [Woeseiaceae bacterium]|nr:hypothetical protein [Woeseiaceae bacterium]